MNRSLQLLPIVVIFCLSSLNINAQYYDLTRSLPSNYSTAGNVDYTKYIQKGINQHKKVKMPNFPIMINSNGINVISNSELFFQKNSLIVLKPNDKAYYAVISVKDVNNVTVKNLKIIGDKNNHIGNNGEWGMGIHIEGSQNIRIISADINKCWGDGIYIGGDVTKINKDITVKDSKIDDCRRNGISVTHGENILLENITISNINSTAPMAGIDIEPNNSNAVINNILLNNINTKNNGNFGIVISLGQLPGTEAKRIQVLVNNHSDYNSKVAFCLAGFREDYRNKKPLSGLIKVSNSKWYNNKITLLAGNYDLGPMTKFTKTQVFNDEVKDKNNKKIKVSVISTKKLQMMKEEHKNYKNIIIE